MCHVPTHVHTHVCPCTRWHWGYLGTVAALKTSHGFVRHKDLVRPQKVSHIQLLLLLVPDVGDVSGGQVQGVLHVKPLSVVHHDEHLRPGIGLLEGLDHRFGSLGADLCDGGVQPIDDGDDARAVLDQAGNGKPPLLLVDALCRGCRGGAGAAGGAGSGERVCLGRQSRDGGSMG